MEMVNMKMDPGTSGGGMASAPVESEKPAYPYGLRISLDKECMEKLGMKDMPEVGTKMMIHCMVVVESCSMSQEGNGEEYKSVGLQITDMAMMAPKKNMAKALYGEEE